MKHFLYSLSALALCACVNDMTYTATNGQKSETLHIGSMWGGQETLRTAGGFEWTGDRVDSFAHGAQTVAAVASMGAAALQDYIAAITSRLATADLGRTTRLRLRNELTLALAELEKMTVE